ncbi:hypothetical protein HYW59_02620 [Candidatus Kaiserbacteria bacterium]|nr:hypothetical protein [Candidatus Kaiserbacteria bacterium]
MKDDRPLWFVEKVKGEERVSSYCRACGETHIPGPRVVRVTKKELFDWIQIEEKGKLHGPVWPILAGAAAYAVSILIIYFIPAEYRTPGWPPLLYLLATVTLVAGAAWTTWLPLGKHNRHVRESRENSKHTFLAKYGRLPPYHVYANWFPGMNRSDFTLLPEGVNNEWDYNRLWPAEET